MGEPDTIELWVDKDKNLYFHIPASGQTFEAVCGEELDGVPDGAILIDNYNLDELTGRDKEDMPVTDKYEERTMIDILKDWAKGQLDGARAYIKSSSRIHLLDAEETPEFHMGYYQAIENLLEKIKELEGKT
jgi:hypothetical protein